MQCEKGYTSYLDFPIYFLLVCGDNGEWEIDLTLPKLSCFKSYIPQPIFRNCPCNIEVVADYGETSTTVYWREPSEIHQYRVDQTHRTGELFYIGETKVTYVSQNKNGDIENCVFNITVSATYCPTLSLKKWNYSCSKGFMYGSMCYRTCPAGFILPPKENGVIVCQKNRTWTEEFPDCIDVTKPIIEDCVPYQTAIVELNSTGIIKWRDPTVNDNADKDITLQKLGYISQGDHVGEGKYYVYYTAQDKAGNVAEQCNIELSMKVLTCPGLHNDSVLSVKCPDGFQNGGECFFKCRVGFKLIGQNKTTCKMAHDVNYAEWDFNDNHPYCEVLRSCESDPIPQNHGNITCDSWLGGKMCFVKCVKDPLYNVMVCGNSGHWRLENANLIQAAPRGNVCDGNK